MRTLIAAIVLSVLVGATFYYVACRKDKMTESKYYNTDSVEPNNTYVPGGKIPDNL